MMRSFIHLLLLFAFIGCSDKKETAKQLSNIPEQPKGSIYGNTKTSRIKVAQVEPTKAEVLHMDSVWLNDIIPFTSKQEFIKQTLGNPDSVDIPNYECGAYISGEEPWGDTVKLWFYNETKIVTFKDKAEIISIKFDDTDFTFHHPKITLSKYTTVEDLAKVFPNSVKRAYEWRDVRDNLDYKLVRIAPKPHWDDEWVLKFYNNELVEIEYWTPC